jgi:DNA-directed RNA polymerase subunit N (RpoN/RPB10)
MLFYVKCPTCSRIISRNYDKYCKDLDDITNDPKLKNNAAERNKQSAALLDKYKIFKMCCRARVIGTGAVPYDKIVQT